MPLHMAGPMDGKNIYIIFCGKIMNFCIDRKLMQKGSWNDYIFFYHKIMNLNHSSNSITQVLSNFFNNNKKS